MSVERDSQTSKGQLYSRRQALRLAVGAAATVPLAKREVIDFGRVKLGETIGKFSFDPTEADRLARLDEDQQRAELSKNLQGFQGEVLDDDPVSHLYHFYFDKQGNTYSHPDRKPMDRFGFEYQLDSRERDGSPAIGFKKVTDMMFKNPGVTTLWFSPAGKASLDEDPNNPYHKVPFIYGQLYMMNYDGEKINAIAIKVDQEGEEALEQFMPDQFHKANKLESDYERNRYLIENPVALAGTVDDLASAQWRDGLLYGGKEGGKTKRSLTVNEMLTQAKEQFSGISEKQEIHPLVKKLTSSQLTDKKELAKVYLSLILSHSSMQKDGKISLQGACGGSTVAQSEIEKLLGIDGFNPLSSSYRLMTQGDQLKQMLNGEKNLKHFVCPKCNYHASGPVGDSCPNCKLTKEEYAEKGGKVC